MKPGLERWVSVDVGPVPLIKYIFVVGDKAYELETIKPGVKNPLRRADLSV